MTLTLELPSELEHELAEEAERRGLSLSEYALLVLATGITPGKTPAVGSELVAFWTEQGLIGTRTDIRDTQAFARSLREQAVTRDLE